MAAAKQVTPHVTIARNDRPQPTPTQSRGWSSVLVRAAAPNIETSQRMRQTLLAMPALFDKRSYRWAFDSGIGVMLVNVEIPDRRWRRVLGANPPSEKPAASKDTAQGGGSGRSICWADSRETEADVLDPPGLRVGPQVTPNPAQGHGCRTLRLPFVQVHSFGLNGKEIRSILDPPSFDDQVTVKEQHRMKVASSNWIREENRDLVHYASLLVDPDTNIVKSMDRGRRLPVRAFEQFIGPTRAKCAFEQLERWRALDAPRSDPIGIVRDSDGEVHRR